MDKIYSKIHPDLLLHLIFRLDDFKQGRQDLIHEDQFIQCSALKLKQGTTFKAHKHLWRSREWNVIAQESWVVISGKVKCFFYDLDNSLLGEYILEQGDASFTLQGGHNYLIMDDNTYVYEYKTGKYEGQSIDKQFI